MCYLHCHPGDFQIYFKYIWNQHINHSLPFYYDKWNVNLTSQKESLPILNIKFIMSLWSINILTEWSSLLETFEPYRIQITGSYIEKKKKKRYDFPNIFLNVRIFNIFLLNILKCKSEYNGYKWGLKVISVVDC